jgi:hypothetical protein
LKPIWIPIEGEFLLLCDWGEREVARQYEVKLLSQLVLSAVGVEKGTTTVISVNFSTYAERRFNNLQTNLVAENA